MKSRWARLLLVVLFAWMCTAGTFTCTSGDDHHDHHHDSKAKSK